MVIFYAEKKVYLNSHNEQFTVHFSAFGMTITRLDKSNYGSNHIPFFAKYYKFYSLLIIIFAYDRLMYLN